MLMESLTAAARRHGGLPLPVPALTGYIQRPYRNHLLGPGSSVRQPKSNPYLYHLLLLLLLSVTSESRHPTPSQCDSFLCRVDDKCRVRGPLPAARYLSQSNLQSNPSICSVKIDPIPRQIWLRACPLLPYTASAKTVILPRPPLKGEAINLKSLEERRRPCQLLTILRFVLED